MGGRKGGSSGRLESMLLGPARAVSFLFCVSCVASACASKLV